MNNYQDLINDLNNPLEIETTVQADPKKVWQLWSEPSHIENWNSPSDEWHTTQAENDIKTGGKFKNRMEATDKSTGFDFEGTYDEVVPEQLIRYHITDGRKVVITFKQTKTGMHIQEAFEAETENPRALQQKGWQAILSNFKRYAESDTHQLS